jgi:hypothetical protein
MTNIKNQINTKFKKFKYQTGTNLLLPACVTLPDCITQAGWEGLLSLFEFLILRTLRFI